MDPLIDYVFGNYGHLFTDAERGASFAILLEAKAKNASEQMVRFRQEKYGVTDPAALALLADGIDAFRQKVVERILRERSDEVVFNHCPKCGAFARTPTACLCPECNHT